VALARLAVRLPVEPGTLSLILLPLVLVTASFAASHALRQAARPLPMMSWHVAPRAPLLPSPTILAGPPRHSPAALAMAHPLPPPSPQQQSIGPAAPVIADVDRPVANEAERQAVTSLPEAPSRALGSAGEADFGHRLAAAAMAQTSEPVTYTAKYQAIAYPMGDISPAEGACSDVIIRAYRALGIDLQELVHRARVGIGDRSIDHRRTETLRKYFERHSASLPVTPYPEDYRPGDIVTYYRPFSRVSRAHIAIVSDVLAPTRRPMVVHNRGWGVQLEDALFTDQITGHYRFTGPLIEVASRSAPKARSGWRSSLAADTGRAR
jgi:uncharacterized protein YijF (DUF1287 family)